MIPLLWVAKLRQFRVTFKLLINLLLQIAPYVDFIMPLLPAPYQAIATASKKWDWASTEEPIVPRKKTHSSGTIADVEEESFNEQDEEDDDEDGDDETKIDSKIAEKIVKSGETNDNKLSSKNISENEDDESEDEMEFNDDTDYDNEDEDEDEE